MTKIQGKSILVGVSARFELARVRVIDRESTVYRREENAASLALKFLRAGCQNIHLNILKADFVKRNKCASLGTCFWDLYSLNTSSKATRWSFYSVLLTNKFQQHFNNNKKNRRQLLYDLLGENQRQRKWNEWCLPVLSFLEFKGIYSFAENKYKRWIQAYIFF